MTPTAALRTPSEKFSNIQNHLFYHRLFHDTELEFVKNATFPPCLHSIELNPFFFYRVGEHFAFHTQGSTA
jgi:hypothetical protein